VSANCKVSLAKLVITLAENATAKAPLILLRFLLTAPNAPLVRSSAVILNLYLLAVC